MPAIILFRNAGDQKPHMLPVIFSEVLAVSKISIILIIPGADPNKHSHPFERPEVRF